ncbi:MAG: DNA-binding response regulator, partial [Gammaproteobacteria bacterium]|nr:DNA-binding response regulator [Gammaproteobacteria bacterium]
IFLTGFGTLPTSSEAFRGGALDFLEKPVDRELLLDRVTEALKMDARRGVHDVQKSTVVERVALLSARERQVLHYVVNGLSTKEMAKELGLSHRTVDTHRAHMMRKMGCSTLLQLMRAISPLLDEGGLFG